MSSTTSSREKFNLGVKSEGAYLTLSVSQMTRDVTRGAPGGDLRRIDYWIVEGKGLARREVRLATSEDARLRPPDVADPDKYIIAREVRSISFEFWDGSAWVPTWDGTGAGPGLLSDQTSPPLGPPSAIAVTIEVPRRRAAPGEEEKTEKYRVVIPIPAGNNFPQPGM